MATNSALLTVLSGENLSFEPAIIQYWHTLVIASLYSDQEATSLNSQFPALLIPVKFVAVANLSNILATCARVIVWYGMNASVVLYEVIHISYIQLIASMNSGESVNVSFHAIISKLTLFQETVLPLAVVIQFESGLELSVGVAFC
ncbi:hypothetical protein J6V86_01300 [bacterium]|nr:hypothetical protein [bacterium]